MEEIKSLLKGLVNEMSRTVNRNQTLEEFRNTYNNLASDIGSLTT